MRSDLSGQILRSVCTTFRLTDGGENAGQFPTEGFRTADCTAPDSARGATREWSASQPDISLRPGHSIFEPNPRRCSSRFTDC